MKNKSGIKMGTESKISLKKAAAVLGIASVLFVLVFLLFIGINDNITVNQTRDPNSISQVKFYSYRGITSPESPSGVIDEFRFTPGRLLNSDSFLVFYTVHQYVDVYLEDELIYSLKPNEDISFLNTPGSNWIKVPLFREDSDKEICIRLTPVYKDVHTEKLDFYLGSEIGIYANILRLDLPQISICVLYLIIGIVLIVVSIYTKKNNIDYFSVFPIGVFALLLGLWRLTDISYMHMILPGKTVLLFYVSISVLMIGSQPILLLGIEKNLRQKNIFICGSIIVSLVCIFQVILQFLGICDMRNNLSITHALIFLSLYSVIGVMVFQWIKSKNKKKYNLELIALLCIVIGAIIDLINYYTDNSSSNLLCTLIAFFCYLLVSGFNVILSYNEQKKIIAEKDSELTQSRIMTMMSQIRSHFVFNILNAISGMCKYDPEKADMTVVRFSRYLRTNIDIMQEDKPISFDTALTHLEDYVLLEQVRFGEKIRFVTDIKERDFLIPPLILQPIVENSIKYGINKKPSGGTVTLSTKRDGGNIIIEISDDGVGFDTNLPINKNSVGLKNIKLRLNHMINGKINVESTPGVGTKTTIIIPHKEI